MAREINRNLYPPMGYRFKDRDGTLHRDESWKKLEARVRDYRARAGVSVGDVWAEIMAQVCAEIPGYCGETRSSEPQKRSSGISFNQRVLHWVIGMLGKKRVNALTLVNREEAVRRAKICSGCPKQRPLVTSCKACLETTGKGREALLQAVPKRDRQLHLHPCEALGEDCSISVHVQQESVDSAQLPVHCWRKKI